MDARLQRRIQRYGWDRAAAYYEQSWRLPLAPAHIKLLAMARLERCERVVDVACGTGLVTFAAAAAVGGLGSVVGTDVSDAMVNACDAQARAHGVAHVRFERMDAEQLQLPSSWFDASLSALGLMYVPDADTAIGEMVRVLRPGGRAVAAVWGQRKRCGWADIFPIVDARVKTEVCPLFFALGTGDRLGSAFRDAGLIDVVSEQITTSLSWPSEQHALAAAFFGGPVALAYSRFDDATRQNVHREYLDSIDAFRSGGGYAVPGEFVIVAGRKPDWRVASGRWFSIFCSGGHSSSMIKRSTFFAYGAVSYLIFFATFCYAIAFVGGFVVPTQLDGAPTDPLGISLAIDVVLLSVFAVQHSVMARPWFKRRWTQIVPREIERSTYVLFASLCLILMFWQWRPLGGMVWSVEHQGARMALWTAFGAGWGLVLLATFLINHFDLFGLRQVWLQLIGQPYSNVHFVVRGPYRVTRHPLYLGFVLAFWATPTMTLSHVAFAAITTAYILVAIQLEEHDLINEHGHAYQDYRRRVPMLIPTGTSRARR